MTHVNKSDVAKFTTLVGKHARVVPSGAGLDRAAKLRIKQDLTAQWKSGDMSKTTARTFKDMLGKL